MYKKTIYLLIGLVFCFALLGEITSVFHIIQPNGGGSITIDGSIESNIKMLIGLLQMIVLILAILIAVNYFRYSYAASIFVVILFSLKILLSIINYGLKISIIINKPISLIFILPPIIVYLASVIFLRKKSTIFMIKEYEFERIEAKNRKKAGLLK